MPIVDRVLAAASVIVVVLAASVVGQRLGHSSSLQSVGDTFDAVQLPESAVKNGALLLWLDSRCPACTASMEAYRSIVALKDRPAIVVLGQEPVDVLARYLSRFDVEPEYIVSSEAPLSGFVGTPTLVLLDSKQTIRLMWTGRLNLGAEQDISAALASLSNAWAIMKSGS